MSSLVSSSAVVTALLTSESLIAVWPHPCQKAKDDYKKAWDNRKARGTDFRWNHSTFQKYWNCKEQF